MVHRDIKPANILFTGENQPVLTDFGIARMLSVTGLTASGAMVGTPAYMAPEIGIGHPGTALSDIYSLGVVCISLVTGQLPFDAEVPMALVMKHINDPVAPSQAVTPICRPAWKPSSSKCHEAAGEALFECGRKLLSHSGR